MEIRRSHDRLISTMGFPILVRWHLYIESGPSTQHSTNCVQNYCDIFYMGDYSYPQIYTVNLSLEVHQWFGRPRWVYGAPPDEVESRDQLIILPNYQTWFIITVMYAEIHVFDMALNFKDEWWKKISLISNLLLLCAVSCNNNIIKSLVLGMEWSSSLWIP